MEGDSLCRGTGGDLRWRAPRRPQRWSDPADATRVGPVCPQPTEPRIPIDLGAPQGDDCLTLNVWASSDTDAGDSKPVMVWMHGGAYILGSSAQPLYHGGVLADGGDAVIVTVNYRLGALGFLDLSSFGEAFDTNLGLRDVMFALQWVRDNIAAFGGDPDRVTFFGESAGAGIVTTLLASPAAAGLFSAAIAQSSPATSIYDHERAAGWPHSSSTRWAGTDEARACPTCRSTRSSPPPSACSTTCRCRTPGTLAFAPIVDGDLVPAHPVKLAREGRSHPVPLIIGTNKHEAALFRWMKSPLMPITPQAIRAMFTEIAAEQPALQLPSEDQIRTAYRGRRQDHRHGSGPRHRIPDAVDLVRRGPPRRRAGLPVPIRLRDTDVAPAAARRRPRHRVALRLGQSRCRPKDPTFKLGGLKAGKTVSARMRARWLNFAVEASRRPAGRSGLAAVPQGRPRDADDRRPGPGDRRSDRDLRTAWGDEVLSFR